MQALFFIFIIFLTIKGKSSSEKKYFVPLWHFYFTLTGVLCERDWVYPKSIENISAQKRINDWKAEGWNITFRYKSDVEKRLFAFKIFSPLQNVSIKEVIYFLRFILNVDFLSKEGIQRVNLQSHDFKIRFFFCCCWWCYFDRCWLLFAQLFHA